MDRKTERRKDRDRYTQGGRDKERETMRAS